LRKDARRFIAGRIRATAVDQLLKSVVGVGGFECIGDDQIAVDHGGLG
jgi:hypothetical protein